MASAYKAFLGGTCGKSNWRNWLNDRLNEAGRDTSGLFNPVVPNWNEAAQKLEDEVKATAPLQVYYLGDPQDVVGFSIYSLFEAVQALYEEKPGVVLQYLRRIFGWSPKQRTIVALDSTGMPDHLVKVMNKIYKDLAPKFPGQVFLGFDALVGFLTAELPKAE